MVPGRCKCCEEKQCLKRNGENGDYSVILDGLVKKRLIDQGRLGQRPDRPRELALPVELGLSGDY